MCTAAVIPVFLGLWKWPKMNGLAVYLGFFWGLGAIVIWGGCYYSSVVTGFRLLMVPIDLDNLAPFIIAPIASWLIAAMVAYGCAYCPLPAKYEYLRSLPFLSSADANPPQEPPAEGAQVAPSG